MNVIGELHVPAIPFFGKVPPLPVRWVPEVVWMLWRKGKYWLLPSIRPYVFIVLCSINTFTLAVPVALLAKSVLCIGFADKMGKWEFLYEKVLVKGQLEDLQGVGRKDIVGRWIAKIVFSSGIRGYCELYCDMTCHVVCSAQIDMALSSRSCRQKGYNDPEQTAGCNAAFRPADFTFHTFCYSHKSDYI